MADNDQDLDNDDEQELGTPDNENLDDEELAEDEDPADTNSEEDDGSADDSDADDDSGADDGTDDDDEEDAVDPVGLAIMQSDGAGAPQVEDFDIRNLPRDEKGLIDPEKANKAIKDHYEKLDKAHQEEGKKLDNVRTTLNQQWQKGSQKFPHIWKNPDLREMALQYHLGSFEKAKAGTGTYLSPAAALKKVDKMYKRGFKQGVSSQKTRRRVVSTAGSARSSGTGDSGKADNEYLNLKKQANSKDPVQARDGRRKLIIYRRNARAAAR